MKIVVFGAGAVGGHVAARLAAGAEGAEMVGRLLVKPYHKRDLAQAIYDGLRR